MSKQQAITELCMISSGTLATLTGTKNYDEQDKVLNGWIDKIEDEQVDVSNCKNWMDIYKLVQ